MKYDDTLEKAPTAAISRAFAEEICGIVWDATNPDNEFARDIGLTAHHMSNDRYEVTLVSGRGPVGDDDFGWNACVMTNDGEHHHSGVKTQTLARAVCIALLRLERAKAK